MIKFNKPLLWGSEFETLSQTFAQTDCKHFENLCRELLKNEIKCRDVQMTSSCTAALEMAVQLIGIEPQDEVIMPSFTHVGTANPFRRAGAEIRWCDIRSDTKNIDENLIEELITSHTKAVVAVHYGGVSCEMDKITEICRRHNLFLIEDCAMAIGAKYRQKPLGSFGDLAVVSFHETKNIHCCRGGALIINREEFVEKAQILIDCGTDKHRFETGKIDHYSWIEVGSNYQMSRLQSAFLSVQLNVLQEVTAKRLLIWERYFMLLGNFLPPEKLPIVPSDCQHNGHLFYLILESKLKRELLT
ncbi:MAG TPA: aminotransferase class I/II-fold pyridoxal phosphate-dependent enzyme, partial [Candidatus Cloacimonadota bacterium]|nr:aminotransferase class I/II-fold pyridoxal phosphate-dependent enzyme [Candidatus Cloacimonadota bacterium]